jgi:hypothetical protein
MTKQNNNIRELTLLETDAVSGGSWMTDLAGIVGVRTPPTIDIPVVVLHVPT